MKRETNSLGLLRWMTCALLKLAFLSGVKPLITTAGMCQEKSPACSTSRVWVLFDLFAPLDVFTQAPFIYFGEIEVLLLTTLMFGCPRVF